MTGMAELSPRQREILDLVAAGRTSKEIAAALGISESTVNWHLSNAFARLGASSRAEAVARAMRDEVDESHTVASTRAPARIPLSSVALAFALTLLLGVVGGALIAGWTLSSPPPPASSAAPSGGASPSVEATVRPTRADPPSGDADPNGGADAVAPGIVTPAPSLPTTPAPTSIAIPALPTSAPALPSVAPALPSIAPVFPAVVPLAPAPLHPLAPRPLTVP
jgi:DNA-binding CsgD family transcriptional regulator